MHPAALAPHGKQDTRPDALQPSPALEAAVPRRKNRRARRHNQDSSFASASPRPMSRLPTPPAPPPISFAPPATARAPFPLACRQSQQSAESSNSKNSASL